MGGKSKSKQSSSSQNVNSNQGVNNSVGMNYGINQSGNFGQNQSNNFGMSSGIGGNQSSSTSQSTQNVWDKQSPFLEDVYGSAQGAFNNAQGQINALTPQVQDQLASSLA